MALASLLVLWIVGLTVALTIRWIRRGFANSRNRGFFRLGFTASLIWLVVGGYLGNDIGIGRGAWAIAAYSDCLKQRSIQPDGSVPADTDWGPCSERFSRDYSAAIDGHWTYAALFAFVPMASAWFLVPLLLWTRRGFLRNRSTMKV
jgi:hypothetical protein